MSTATAPVVNDETPYLTPAGVAVGDQVLWSSTPNTVGSVAFVTAVGLRTIDVLYFDNMSLAGTVLTGVVWEGAPRDAVEQSLRGDNGVWNFSPIVARVRKLEEQLAALLAEKKPAKS